MKSDRELLEETHGTVIELKTVMLGVPGTADKGLAGAVASVTKGHRRLNERFWILVGILIGTGIVGTGYTLFF